MSFINNNDLDITTDDGLQVLRLINDDIMTY